MSEERRRDWSRQIDRDTIICTGRHEFVGLCPDGAEQKDQEHFLLEKKKKKQTTTFIFSSSELKEKKKSKCN